MARSGLTADVDLLIDLSPERERRMVGKQAGLHHGDTEKEIDDASREAHLLSFSVFSVSPWLIILADVQASRSHPV
jgi:hypothetical protein